jgi:predicted nucleotide-binding protein
MESEKTKIQRLIEEGEKFTFENFCFRSKHGPEYAGRDTLEWLAWTTRSYNIVIKLASKDSPTAKMVCDAIGIGTEGNKLEHFELAKTTFLKALHLTLDALEEDTFGELKKTSSSSRSLSLSNKVFIVHGHDHGFKTEVEQFIHEIGLEAVVLHRKPDEGRTIIEKFEKHSDVGYAFILLTPDEVAYTVDQDNYSDEDRKKEKRARPNVIFEFGYFVGRLGRSRVCCLHKGDVTLPSDLDGLIYKKIEGSLDSQAYSLIKELKAAGYNVNI